MCSFSPPPELGCVGCCACSGEVGGVVGGPSPIVLLVVFPLRIDTMVLVLMTFVSYYLLLCYEIRKVRREGKSRWYFVFFIFSGHFSFSWSGFIFDFDFGLSLLFLSVLLVFAWWL